MSRIIVKNLPKKIKEERLREFFSSKGTVTDVQLKFTKEGVFRRFAFVGFKDEAQAAAAKEYFNNAYLGTSKLQVEMSAALGGAEKPRSWSKYSQDSSAYQRLHPQQQVPTAVKEEEEEPKADFANAFLKDLEGDEQFAEFLAVHGSQRAAWGNDARPPAPPPTSHRQPADAAGSGDEEEPSSGGERLPTEGGGTQAQRAKPKQPLPVQEFQFTLKVSGLPYKCKKKQIKDFFKPAQVLSLRLPPRVKGIAYLGFRREKDMKQALHKHHSFMAGRRIDVTRYTKKPPPEEDPGKGRSKKWRQFEDLGNPQETLADTGRLFIRNLSYTITEEELEALFRKYGPLEEVHLSIDRVTRKPKGFAFVSFLFPEHAIRAFSELDGHMLQGRLLHVLPGKAKETAAAGEQQEEQGEPQSFKDKKEAELKKASGKGHNWNALFLGANALADVMAERYSTSKQELLGTETGESSVAVRMALGESQVVAETREFLERHGVALDAFSKPATERSRTTILVKNLPAKTDPGELRQLFGKFGLLSRVVLPPWGVTALVEFQEPTEARAAFRHLAYSRFRHVPLYLEWAPTGVFTAKKVEQPDRPEEDTVEPEDEEEPPEPDTTLFVKNLSFSTSEQALCQHFEQCGTVHEATIAKKKDLKNPGQRLSMGFGFVQFRRRADAQRALKELQRSQLDGHALELRLSTRATSQQQESGQRPGDRSPEEGTKILVRNVPFQASDKEVRQLFSVFGSLRDVRLPKKMAGGRHRGFGFVDFHTKNDAKRAFEALCQSTHLYGRRLVLEWASTDDQEVDSLRKKTAHHFLLQGASGPSSKRLKKSDLLASLDGAAPDL